MLVAVADMIMSYNKILGAYTAIYNWNSFQWLSKNLFDLKWNPKLSITPNKQSPNFESIPIDNCIRKDKQNVKKEELHLPKRRRRVFHSDPFPIPCQIEKLPVYFNPAHERYKWHGNPPELIKGVQSEESYSCIQSVSHSALHLLLHLIRCK